MNAIILGLALIAIGAGLSFIYFRGKEKKPPGEIALETLAALEKSHLAETGQIDEYYRRLSRLLRSYIEGRFKIPALGRSSLEIYTTLKSKGAEQKFIDMIKIFLEEHEASDFHRATRQKEDILTDTKFVQKILEGAPPHFSCKHFT